MSYNNLQCLANWAQILSLFVAVVSLVLQLVPKKKRRRSILPYVFALACFVFGLGTGVSVLPKYVLPPTEIYRTYEWQWAGENWYGRVTLAKVNDENIISKAQVGLMGKTGDGRVWMDGQVLTLVEDGGSFEINDDGGIEINLRVKKKHRLTGEVNQEILKGTLQQTQCFAGRVTYSGEIGTYYGDMMLVDYRSDFALSVDDWFSNEQEWFEKYLIDCDCD